MGLSAAHGLITGSHRFSCEASPCWWLLFSSGLLHSRRRMVLTCSRLCLSVDGKSQERTTVACCAQQIRASSLLHRSRRPVGLLFLISHFPPRPLWALSNCLHAANCFPVLLHWGRFFLLDWRVQGPLPMLLLAKKCPGQQKTQSFSCCPEAVPLRNRG